MFDGIEGKLAQIIYGVPAVKGLEFGSGFAGSTLRGSQNNDPYTISDSAVKTVTNNAGGILGGITTGMPVVFRAAIKPTSSIAKQQQSVSLSKMEEQSLTVHGRHDPCIVPRAVPVIEAATAIAFFDICLSDGRLLEA
jgi:chorismate synthase